jgi:hypothetical protein
MNLKSIALALMLAPVIAVSQSSDPVVGDWIWLNKRISVSSDRKAKDTDLGGVGTWKFMQNKELERKYEFSWEGGGKNFIDRMTLSRDGTKLDGTNQEGKQIWALKAAPENRPAHVGSWNISNLADGYKAVYELNEDGALFRNGTRIGRWDVTKTQLIISYNAAPWNHDRLELPIRDRKLRGKNTAGNTIILERKAP